MSTSLADTTRLMESGSSERREVAEVVFCPSGEVSMMTNFRAGCRELINQINAQSDKNYFLLLTIYDIVIALQCAILVLCVCFQSVSITFVEMLCPVIVHLS